jgi:hypothetical protein
MQGIRKKQQKNEKNRALCRACAHGKGLLVTLPCAPARQRSHVAAACSPGKLLGVPGGAFAVRAGVLAHGKAHRTAQSCRTATRWPHGNVGSHGKGVHARQRRCARQSACRTAAQGSHGKGHCRAKCRRARQRRRCRRVRCRPRFAVHLGSFAVQSAARQCLAFP